MVVKKRGTIKKSSKPLRVKHTRKPKREKKVVVKSIKKSKIKQSFTKNIRPRRIGLGPKKIFSKVGGKKNEPEEIISEPTLKDIWALVAKGRTRGFITQTEVEGVFSRPERYLDLYEGFMDLLDRNGVTIVETAGNLLGQRGGNKELLKQFQGAQPDMDTPFDLGQISSDSIQMYLREIGKIPLLKSA